MVGQSRTKQEVLVEVLIPYSLGGGRDVQKGDRLSMRLNAALVKEKQGFVRLVPPDEVASEEDVDVDEDDVDEDADGEDEPEAGGPPGGEPETAGAVNRDPKPSRRKR